AVLQELASQKELLAADTAELQRQRDFARSQRGELAERELNVRHRLRDLKDGQHAFEMQTTEIRHQIATLEERLRDEFQVELAVVAAEGVTTRSNPVPAAQSAEGAIGENASDGSGEAATQVQETEPVAQVSDEAARAQVEEQINKLRRKIKQLGQVNTDSLKELDDLENRYARLSGQLQDLVEAKNTLEEIIRRINTES